MTATLLVIALLTSAYLAFRWYQQTRAYAHELELMSAVINQFAAGEWNRRIRTAELPALYDFGRTANRWLDTLETTLDSLSGERNLLERILENMAEGVLVLDEKQHIVLLNRSLREMLLLPAAALRQPLLEVLRHSELQRLLGHVRQGEKVNEEIEIAGLKPRRLLVQASAIGGDPEGIVAVFVDVTDVRRLETLRRDFVANVSHELRTPVASVRSAAETLRDGAISDPVHSLRFLDIVERNASRLHSLVEDLLDLSRIESKAFRLHTEPIPLGATVTYCFSLVRDRAEKKRLILAHHIEPADLHIDADRRALEQVLTNLIDNAVKYCPDGRNITVSGEIVGSGARIHVADTGPGIAAEHLPRLFERFYRVDSGRSRDIGGTGLGLSIAKHLVEAMSGSLSVTSQVGSGTTFSFTLPLWTEPVKSHE